MWIVTVTWALNWWFIQNDGITFVLGLDSMTCDMWLGAKIGAELIIIWIAKNCNLLVLACALNGWLYNKNRKKKLNCHSHMWLVTVTWANCDCECI